MNISICFHDIIIVFHREITFFNSIVIYKEIPENCNFRLTSFRKKNHISKNIERRDIIIGKKVRNRPMLKATKFENFELRPSICSTGGGKNAPPPPGGLRLRPQNLCTNFLIWFYSRDIGNSNLRKYKGKKRLNPEPLILCC